MTKTIKMRQILHKLTLNNINNKAREMKWIKIEKMTSEELEQKDTMGMLEVENHQKTKKAHLKQRW